MFSCCFQHPERNRPGAAFDSKTVLALGCWLSIWDLKVSNLKIIDRANLQTRKFSGQIFKSTNQQINKSTLWVLGDG